MTEHSRSCHPKLIASTVGGDSGQPGAQREARRVVLGEAPQRTNSSRRASPLAHQPPSATGVPTLALANPTASPPLGPSLAFVWPSSTKRCTL